MEENQTRFQPGLTVRSVVVMVIAIALAMYWVLRTELLTGSFATGGTPPAVSIGWLLLLVALGATVGRKVGLLRLSRAEMLVVYACVALAIPLASYGGLRAFLPHLTVLSYYDQPDNRFGEFWAMLPDWQVLRDQEIIRQCFEAAPDERVPWGHWLPVLSRWFLLFLAIFLTLMGMLTLFRKRWVEGDRLQFPLLYLPTQILTKPSEGRSLFRNPVFYVGFGVAFIHNLTSVLSAFNPGFPALGTITDLGGLFTEAPWDAIRPIAWHHFPQVVGLGYLVSLEVLFSVWFFFLANKTVAVMARAFGYDNAAMPFMMEQSSGGYPIMALILVFMARKEIAATLSRAFGARKNSGDENEVLPPWGAVLAFFGGFAFLLGWASLSGMNVLLAGIFFATVLSYSLVYSRIRAEVGIPYTQVFPTDFPIKGLEMFLGSRGMLAFGHERNLVALGSLGWLSYHYTSHVMGAYQIDGLRLADDAMIARRSMAAALVLAMALGFAGAAWAHLTAYYQYGQNIVDGGAGLGDARARVAVQTFESMQMLAAGQVVPDATRAGFAVGGAAVVLGLSLLRFFFLRFPLHPIGYLIATTYWNQCPVWGDLFLVWMIKSLVLKLGGVRLYRQLIPCFIGLAIGHFFWGGLVWGNINPFIPMEVARRYWLPRV